MTRIVARNVDLDFPIAPQSARSLRNLAIETAARIGGRMIRHKTEMQMVRALANVSFTLNEGDRLALVGHNGSGKTTLIRLLAGIYTPSAGALTVTGRRVPLFDISPALDEEGTGHENIRLGGLMLGMTPREIDAAAGAIAEDSELGPYLAMPYRTYSDGMKLRLVFSIATAVRGDILLVDEWISVGDAAMRAKIRDRLLAGTRRGGIVVLASHEEPLLREICTHGLHLDGGKVKSFGPLDAVLDSLARESSG